MPRSGRELTSGTPDHVKNDFNVIPSAKIKKSQVPTSHRFFMDYGIHFGIILEAFWYTFHIIFGIVFWHPFFDAFFLIFDAIWAPFGLVF